MTASEESFDDILRAGIDALRSGDRMRATHLLARAVRLDPQSERAWLFLAGAVSEPEQRRTCLERVISLNPQNEAARRGLRSLSPTPNSQPPTPAAPRRPIPASPNYVIDLLGAQPQPTPAPLTPDSQLPTPMAPRLPIPASPNYVIDLLGAQPQPIPAPLTPDSQLPTPAAPATGVTVPLEAQLVSLPIETPGAGRRRSADRLVWSLVLALGLLLMVGSAIYAVIIVRG